MKSVLRAWGWVMVLAVTSLACSLVTGTFSPTPTPLPPVQVSPTPAQPAPSPAESPTILGLQAQLVDLYQRVNPGVVTIQLLSTELGGSSLGSGFVIDTHGHIVTNYHVVRDAEQDPTIKLEVDFPSGYKTYGEIIGTDSDSDLAVIKVDAPAEELVPLPLGDSEQLEVGQIVVAIGNPHGLSGTMTFGVISSIGRTMPSLHEAPGGSTFTAGGIIQTDAAINPGNSGGPLLNLDGEVIGVNVAIQSNNFDFTGQPVNSGIGFTIPVNIVRRVVPHLIAEGKYEYPYLGIASLPDDALTLVHQEALELPQTTGVYVLEVAANSPAEKAGLRGGRQTGSSQDIPKGGDLIIGIDDVEVRDFNDLISYLILHTEPGDTVTLTVLRDGEPLQLDVTLAPRP
ncbi:MAG: PDZ domain-containing protein [Anaerolineae bacterium]|nr:MAG: PDZ domain-containing protein [Anaerolineae bacterium]